MKINVTMDFWGVGGAERFWQRLSKKLPQYEWAFTTEVDPHTDLVIYSNNYRFYEQAKRLNKKVAERVTGPRSYGLVHPSDLSFLICSSKAGFDRIDHSKKCLIYNGIDLDSLKIISPISCDLLYGCARVGIGQAPEKAIQYAIKNSRHLTITGSRQHLAENTYKELKSKYPQVCFTGLLDEDVMLGYIKGCKAGIMPTSTHGLSNFVLELVACDKPLINIGNVEVPNKNDIDINITAKKYNELISPILDSK